MSNATKRVNSVARHDEREPADMSSVTSRGGVDDIIRLAVVSASQALRACVRKPEVSLRAEPCAISSAFEQRIVALFSE